MKLDCFIGIKALKDLVPTKFNATIQWIMNWWNDHDSGARTWNNVNAFNGTFTTLTVNGTVITIPLPIAAGGTNSSTALANGLLMVSAGGKIVEIAADTSANSKKITNLANGTAATDAAAFGQIASGSNLNSYRRPVLQYSSGTVVNMETGIDGTSGELRLVWPDGTVSTDSTGSHFNIDLTRVASSTQSGLRTGTVANNTWYACYATKNSTNIIGIADTVLPIQSNYSTLNSNFGSNSWIYVGMIRYGDNSTIANAILRFTQSGNMTLFRNTLSDSNTGVGQTGHLLATVGSAASLTWTYSPGTGAANVPVIFNNCFVNSSFNLGATGTTKLQDSGGNFNYMQIGGVTGDTIFMMNSLVDITGGLKTSTPAASASNLVLAGWWDGVLGVGSNPLL